MVATAGGGGSRQELHTTVYFVVFRFVGKLHRTACLLYVGFCGVGSVCRVGERRATRRPEGCDFDWTTT